MTISPHSLLQQAGGIAADIETDPTYLLVKFNYETSMHIEHHFELRTLE